MVFVSVCWVEPICGCIVLSRKEAVVVVCVCCGEGLEVQRWWFHRPAKKRDLVRS